MDKAKAIKLSKAWQIKNHKKFGLTKAEAKKIFKEPGSAKCKERREL